MAGMAGFGLPKLRWLVIGAVAAGFWAARQEPLDRREQRVASRPAASISEQQPQRPPTRQLTQSGISPRIEQAVPRPSKDLAISLKPAENTVAQRVYTTSRVRLREAAGTSAPIVATLEPGQAVTILGHSGKWHQVTAVGQKGWVQGDYLGLPDPHIPRPKEPVAKAGNDTAPVSAISAWIPPAPKRPARPPQSGDCQCPYDLMIDGKQCGDHSAYVMREKKAQCYL
jgi:hypothetical protein